MRRLISLWSTGILMLMAHLALGQVPTVGFDRSNSTVLEMAGTHRVAITVDTIFTSPVIVSITDNLVGTATDGGTDYTFSTQSLTFPTTATYPLTQYLSIPITLDQVVETGESFQLGLAVTGGTANTSNTTHTTSIQELEPGIIINEFSSGPSSGEAEYVELLVVGQPGKTVDLRGWILDDNNGDFSGGSWTGVGISRGYLNFQETCAWKNVPVGSLIVLYNAVERNVNLPADDSTDANGDYLYVLGIQEQVPNCNFPATNGYFDAHAFLPNTSGNSTYPATNTETCWDRIVMENFDDGLQTRRPDGTFYTGFSFGNGFPGFFDINVDNHPFGANGDNSYGPDAAHLGLFGGGRVFSFNHSVNADYNLAANWQVDLVAIGNPETPGAGNNAANTAFINSLRTRFPINTVSVIDTCELKRNETQVFTRSNPTGEDEIFLRLVNRQAIDHGEAIVRATYANDGSANVRLTGKPYLHSELYEVTVANSPDIGNYDITLFLPNSELEDLRNEYNSALNAAGLSVNFSTSAILNALQMIKSSVDPADASNDSQVDTALINTLTYLPGPAGAEAGYELTSTFSSGFSQFRLAIKTPANSIFPVEWVDFRGETRGREVWLSWETANEVNHDHFIVERRVDGEVFQDIGQVEEAIFEAYHYEFLDQTPRYGLNYYRIRQVDLDGTFSHSQTVAVTVDVGDRFALLKAYPNPMQDRFQLALTFPSAGSLDLYWYTPT